MAWKVLKLLGVLGWRLMPELGGKLIGCVDNLLGHLWDAGFRKAGKCGGDADDSDELFFIVKDRGVDRSDVVVVFGIIECVAAFSDLGEFGQERFFIFVGASGVLGKGDTIKQGFQFGG